MTCPRVSTRTVCPAVASASAAKPEAQHRDNADLPTMSTLQPYAMTYDPPGPKPNGCEILDTQSAGDSVS